MKKDKIVSIRINSLIYEALKKKITLQKIVDLWILNNIVNKMQKIRGGNKK